MRAEDKCFASLYSPSVCFCAHQNLLAGFTVYLGTHSMKLYFGTGIVPASATGNSSVHTHVSLTLPPLQDHLFPSLGVGHFCYSDSFCSLIIIFKEFFIKVTIAMFSFICNIFVAAFYLLYYYVFLPHLLFLPSIVTENMLCNYILSKNR